MNAHKLPYDMGNAGDLLKHGVLAEFVHWHCQNFLSGSEPFRFLDPFGGLPWCDSVDSFVKKRVNRLGEIGRHSPLHDAQLEIADGRYYGSGHLVRAVAKNQDKESQILVSDCEEEFLHKLLRSGLDKLQVLGFNPQDGYSILRPLIEKRISADLVLIDPFADFLPACADRIVPLIADLTARSDIGIVLFVLNKSQTNRVGQNWESLKREFLPNACSLSCRPLRENKLKGEKTYHMEVVLQSKLLQKTEANALRNGLKTHAMNLSEALDHSVIYNDKIS